MFWDKKLFSVFDTYACCDNACIYPGPCGETLGYGTGFVCMMVAIIIFFGGTRMYSYKKTTRSPLIQILQVFVASGRNRNLKLPTSMGQLYDDIKASMSHTRVPI